MGWKVASGGKAAGGGEKIRFPGSSAAARSRMKLWVVRATTTVLLWTCVVQLTAVGDTWGPRVLKGWPSCLTAPEEEPISGAAAVRPLPVVDKAALPPKSECLGLGLAPPPAGSLADACSLSFVLFLLAVCAGTTRGFPSWALTLTAGLHCRTVVCRSLQSFPGAFPRLCMKMTAGWWEGFRSFSCAPIG